VEDYAALATARAARTTCSGRKLPRAASERRQENEADRSGQRGDKCAAPPLRDEASISADLREAIFTAATVRGNPDARTLFYYLRSAKGRVVAGGS